MKKRFYIDTQANDDKAYLEALRHAIHLANEDEEITRIILLIGQKGNHGWFERTLGSDTVKNLYKGTKFQDCRVPIKFETIRTYSDQYEGQKDIVFVCGLDSEQLFNVDDYYCVDTIITIPWVKEYTIPWLSTWPVTDILTGDTTNDLIVEPSCIVKEAMKNLTHVINMSTGIQNSSDNNFAKTILLSLHEKGEALNPIAIRSYLLRELNWLNKYASDLIDIIHKLNNGNRFQGGIRKKSTLKRFYDQWAKECSGKT